MNTRVKHLHSNKLATAVTGLEEDFAALKGASQLTGGASITYTVSTNSSSYDWNGTIFTGSSNSKFFLVTITGATGTVLYGNILAAVSVNGFTSRYTGADWGNDTVALDEGGLVGPVITNVWNIPNTGSQGANVNQAQIELQVSGAAGQSRNVWLKVYAFALQPVSITVTAL